MSTKVWSGGEKLKAVLENLAKKLNQKAHVDVGFFAGSTEPNGEPSAEIALINEYGGTRTGTKKDGTSYTAVTPARPFFRNMIQVGRKHWGSDLGNNMLKTNLDISTSLALMGEQMVDELKESIQAPDYSPNKESTIKRKGSEQTLIDSADMINAVTFKVEE